MAFLAPSRLAAMIYDNRVSAVSPSPQEKVWPGTREPLGFTSIPPPAPPGGTGGGGGGRAGPSEIFVVWPRK